MKKVLFLLITAGVAHAQNVVFPDVNFKKAIIAAYPAVDTNKDQEISFEEAKQLKSIRNLASFPQITDATGIEAFVNLTELDLSKKDLTSINLSGNTKLVTLNLRENKLAGSLNLTALGTLKTLDANKNQLAELHLPSGAKLEILYANENQLTNVQLGGLPNLKRLFLVSNHITSLDLSANLLLERLHIDNNRIASLDLAGLTKLNWMSVNNNRIANIKFNNNQELKTILAQNNSISVLDFRDGYPNTITLINLTGNADFNLIIKDCNDTLPAMPTVEVEDNCTLAVAGSQDIHAVFYPNPVNDFIRFSGLENVQSYQIISAEGRVVLTKGTAGQVPTIDVSMLAPGAYVLRVFAQGKTFTHRFLKQ